MFGMPEQRVVVESDLGVETDQLLVLGDDQRIDLEQAHVLVDEGLVELRQQRTGLLGEIAVELQRVRDGAHVMRPDAGGRIDREGHDLLRRVVRDLFDVHAAFGRDDEGDAARSRGRPASTDRIRVSIAEPSSM